LTAGHPPANLRFLMVAKGADLLTTRDDASGSVHREIEELLNRSAIAWSAGDLDAFMECYEDSPDTIYLTATRIVAGYSGIRAMYAERFVAGSGQVMAALEIKVIRLVPLGADHAMVIGSYSLEGVAASAQDHTGMCSLVLHKTAQGWRISADHTS
jgi:uncharacterized protein (TIGR02246 family)